MYYLSIALILLGLASILYYFLGPVAQGSAGNSSQDHAPPQDAPPHRTAPASEDTLPARSRMPASVSASEPPAADDILILQGTLFLGFGEKLPILFEEQASEQGFSENPETYDGLRRMGPATLIVEKASFLIRCEGAAYSYSAYDLEQILFQDDGIALLPHSRTRPTPVFLTAKASELKEYVKKYSRMEGIAVSGSYLLRS